MTITVATFNANGLRSALRKGLSAWLRGSSIDILCVQETKAKLSTLAVEEYSIEGYHVIFRDAVKPGYSGVAIYSRYPIHVCEIEDWTHPVVVDEGRFISAQILGVNIINVYMPSGTTGDNRQAIKWSLLQDFEKYIKKWQESAVILMGDMNIAHNTIDLKNWKNNMNKSGFLPYERSWMDAFLAHHWVDTLRHTSPYDEIYTWWSTRAQSRVRNVGWRIDYQFIHQKYVAAVTSSWVDNTIMLSDHAPFVVEYAYERFSDTSLSTDN